MYDSIGNLVTSGTVLPDGRNEVIDTGDLAPGTYQVRVVAEGATSGEYFLDVNTPPVINDGDLSLSATSIDENGSVTLTGSFTDPNISDTHTVTVTWGDGSSSPAVVNRSTA